MVRGFGQLNIDTVPVAAENKRAVLFRRTFGHIRGIKRSNSELSEIFNTDVNFDAACPDIARSPVRLIGSTLVGLWEILENMAFGAEFDVES